MAYRTLVSEENELPEGQDNTISPFLRFESQEDPANGEKREKNGIEVFFYRSFLSFQRIALEPSAKPR